jgi:hypothetical protein
VLLWFACCADQNGLLCAVPASDNSLQEEKKAEVFVSMRRARANARLVGVRQKRADDKAKEADAPKAKAPAADAE